MNALTSICLYITWDRSHCQAPGVFTRGYFLDRLFLFRWPSFFKPALPQTAQGSRVKQGGGGLASVAIFPGKREKSGT
jgi:hypothetical protein